MSKEVQPFKFKDHEVRTVTDEKGEPWFVAKDVCAVLGIANVANVMSRIPDAQKGVRQMDTLGGTQRISIISEAGLYRLVMRSDKPEAEPFIDWVTSEVLPTIRRTGGYIQAAPEETPEEIMARGFIIAQATIEAMKKRMVEHRAKIAEQRARIEEHKAKIEDQQAQIEEAKPKVLFADAVSSSHNCILIGELAKILRQNNIDIGQNRLFQWLRKHGWLIRRHGADYNMPTQKAVEKGVFEIKERAINNPDGTVFVTKTTVVTGKGQVYFVNRFLKGQGAMEPA